MAIFSVTVDGIYNNQPIPERFARCLVGHKGKGANIRPAIRWEGAPSGTKSYAIVVVDKDVPTSFELANREGKTIPASLPRRNFYHWLQVDIPEDVTSIPEGAAGKVRIGISGCNDYGANGTDFGLGYDGPCPPWNDERLHHYHFIVYALKTKSLSLKEGFNGIQAEEVLRQHALATAEIVGTYTTNQVRKNAA